MDSSSMIVHIRQYVDDTDKSQVYALYREGWISMIPTMHHQMMLFSPIHWTIQSMIVGSVSYYWNRRSSNFLTIVAKNRKEESSIFCWWKIVLPCLILLKGYSWFVKRQLSFLVEKIVDKALQDGDLADITNTYMKSGGGTFLVATTTNNDNNNKNRERIVGMVGGITKTEQKYDGDDDDDDENKNMKMKTMELRRMSVDSNYRNQGIGTKLVNELEKYAISTKQYSKIYLNCTSTQPAAMSLYSQKCHYQLIKKNTIKLLGVDVNHYEKEI